MAVVQTSLSLALNSSRYPAHTKNNNHPICTTEWQHGICLVYNTQTQIEWRGRINERHPELGFRFIGNNMKMSCSPSLKCASSLVSKQHLIGNLVEIMTRYIYPVYWTNSGGRGDPIL